MNHSDAVEKFAQKAGITKVDADKYIKALASVMEEFLKVDGDSARFADLGTFKVERRKARKGMNPRTKEEILIPEKNRVSFKASKAFGEYLNKA